MDNVCALKLSFSLDFVKIVTTSSAYGTLFLKSNLKKVNMLGVL